MSHGGAGSKAFRKFLSSALRFLETLIFGSIINFLQASIFTVNTDDNPKVKLGLYLALSVLNMTSFINNNSEYQKV